jgi:hypothetical protein
VTIDEAANTVSPPRLLGTIDEAANGETASRAVRPPDLALVQELVQEPSGRFAGLVR